MELHEKLQELRKRKGLTQEELAEALYVSRTAISKWESGRGYPSIDSLKAISKFFSVTIDELLSGEQLLTVAEADGKEKERRFCDLVFGCLDCGMAMLLLLPFFRQEAEGLIQSVSLPALGEISPYLGAAFWIVVAGSILWGVLTFALQNCHDPLWVQNRCKGSLLFSGAGVLLFIISMQPYAAALVFLFLVVKGLILIKKP